MKVILINGDPVSGFCYSGPFESPDEAMQWAGRVGIDKDWWVTELDDPEADTAISAEDAERQRLYEQTGDERLRG